MAKVLITGAGPAGIMAAIFAAKKGHSVCIIERNAKIGRKLFITGKGRCNLTNNRPDFLGSVIRNPKFLYSSLSAFSPQKCMEYFESIGVRLKIERGGRVFPLTDKSTDIIDALYEELKKLKVKVCFQENLLSLIAANNSIVKAITDKSEYIFDHYILASGGVSYPKTGSDGSGLLIAQELSINITELKPGLVPIILDESILPQGLSLKNVKVKIVNQEDKTIAEDFGEMLFTENGVSGPIILSISSRINRYNCIKELTLLIDLKPALSYEALDLKLIREFEAKNNMQLKNFLHSLMPESLISLILRKANLSGDMKVNQISKELRKVLVHTIKNISFQIFSLGNIEEAIITSGGVSVTEIDPKTMKSLEYGNLSFAGEMIDVDALTGGYNLQIALATGYLAGASV